MEEDKKIWSETESNRRHGDFQSPALPTELPDHVLSKDYTYLIYRVNMSIKNFFVPLLFFCIFFSEASYSADIHPPDDWSFFHERGLRQYNAKMYKDSHDSMMKALRRNPRSYESANILAEIFLLEKNRHRAIEYYELSLKINDEQPSAHNRLGELLEFFGKHDDAYAHFKRGYELDSSSRNVMLNYSRYLRRRGDKNEADRIFMICYNSGLDAGKPLFARGKEIQKLRPAEAESLFQKALDVSPAYTEAYLALGDLYRQEKSYEKAAVIIEKLKLANTDYAPAYFYLGNIYYNNRLNGNIRKFWINLAIKNIEEGLKLDPENEDNLFNLAEIYRHIGERDKAAVMEQRAVAVMKKRAQATE